MKNPMIYLLKQAQNPRGWFGRWMLSGMNRGHATLTEWGLKHISIEKDFTILDVGCGGGKTVQKLALLAPDGRVFGIDNSGKSVQVSKKINHQLIQEGRVEIRHSSVSQLPFSDNTFNLVTAVETHYFWPNPINDMHEILRVLKPGGNLLIIGEVYKGGNYEMKNPKFLKMATRGEVNMTCPGVEDFDAMFAQAEYTNVSVFEEIGKKYICAKGDKRGLIKNYL